MLSRAVIIALLISLAQDEQKPNPQPQPPSIKVQVNEVIVPVTVTDDRGRFVSNLDANDFRIQDEGQDQTSDNTERGFTIGAVRRREQRQI
jgi:hypothetical protein